MVYGQSYITIIIHFRKEMNNAERLKAFHIILITTHNEIENGLISKQQLIRKSTGFVYGIWQYKVLNMIKENIRSKTTLEENNR